MVELEKLKVSLTKNGYMKIAKLVREHPRWEVLDNISGVYDDVNLVRSQVANIMGQDASGEPPEVWDEIRQYGPQAIDCFTLVAIVMSHVDLIGLLRSSYQGDMKGYLQRGDIGEKAYTNLVYALATCDLCDYVKGADGVTYDMRGLVYNLREAGPVVRELIELKLRKCGWIPPDRPGGVDLCDECESNNIHRVFGLEPREFRSWLRGTLRIRAPETGFRPRPPR